MAEHKVAPVSHFDEELSELAAQLWASDTNRCEPGVHFKINKQGRIYDTRTTERDAAPDKLFTSVNEDVVFKIPTFHWFVRLLDNYELSTGQPEVVTEEELKETDEFLNAVLSTTVMKLAHDFLVKIHKSPADKAAFKRQLTEMWFKLYKRNRIDQCLNSCGFEHVFVGETRGTEILGLHNWISFYLLEKAGTINYNGFVGRSDQKKPRLLSVQFTFKGGQGKPVGGSFIGVSPEFEFALYTVCFLVNRGSQLRLRFADMEVEVNVHPLGKGIGTAYATDISGRR